MITQVFKSATNIKLMPIRALQMFSQTDWLDPYDANLVIYKLEKESNYKITNITTETDTGNQITIGQRFEANLYISYNDYVNNNLIHYLDEIFKSRYTLSLCLGDAVPWTDPELEITPPPIINSNNALRLSFANGVSHWYEIEGVEFRPRMIIHFTVILKGKLLDNNIFY